MQSPGYPDGCNGPPDDPPMKECPGCDGDGCKECDFEGEVPMEREDLEPDPDWQRDMQQEDGGSIW